MYEPDFDWKGERFTVKNGYAVKIPKKWCSNDDAYKDRNMLIDLLKTDGFNLNYASPDLKDDFYVVHVAIKQDGNSILYASKRLRTNVSFIVEAFENKADKNIYLQQNPDTQANMDIIHAMLKEHPYYLHLLPQKVKTNKEMMAEIIMRNPESFDRKFIIFWDREILIHVMKNANKHTEEIMQHLHDGSLEMYITAIKFGPTGCFIKIDELKKNNRHVAKAIFERETYLRINKYNYISDRLRNETHAYVCRPDDDKIIALLCKTNKYANCVPEAVWPSVFEYLT